MAQFDIDKLLDSKALNDFLACLNLDSQQIELTKQISVILIPLLITALLFFLTGWFFRSMKRRKKEKQEETIAIKTEIPENIKELEDYKEKFIELYNLTQGKKVKRGTIKDNSNEKETPLINEEQDDLTKIKGINSKIQYILRINTIDSYKKLAETPTETLQFLLDKYGGSAYKIYNPTSWNQQAKLLVDGKLNELAQLQRLLD